MGKIEVKNISKAYKIYPSRFARLLEWLSFSQIKRHSLKWTINDLNFEVSPGESLGIIGMNGAGKSTLLKIITGTTSPTTGSIKIFGRVAALLELGMGFQPDFTGKQNVYMAGQLLGLKSHEIDTLLPDIEAFAEIGEAINQPVRVYSSGMQVRLAFSLATAVRPDILIIDEALSVGDVYFQHKSFEKIRKFKENGTTLLIVSHDKQAIISICDRAILLNNGKLEKQGHPEEVMDYYNALLGASKNVGIEQIFLPNGKVQTVSGSKEAQIISLILTDSNDKQISVANVGQELRLNVRAKINQNIPQLILGFMIKDRAGQSVYGTNTHHWNLTQNDLIKNEVIEFNITFNANLGPGTYTIAIAVTGSESHHESNFEWRDVAVIFEIINYDKNFFVGSTWLQPTIEIKRET